MSVGLPQVEEGRGQMPEVDRLKLDYEQTLTQFRSLQDIRFKLLTAVPTVSGVAVLFQSSVPSNGIALALGLLGFFATVGIVFYEQRNSQFYDHLVHRARAIEKKLGFESFTAGIAPGGLFNEQRSLQRPLLLGMIVMWHDRGLSLVYGAALGGWSYIAFRALSGLIGRTHEIVPVALAVAVTIAVIAEFHRLEQVRE
jgi:hypothetical protein